MFDPELLLALLFSAAFGILAIVVAVRLTDRP